jgi:hypothetical protein
MQAQGRLSGLTIQALEHPMRIQLRFAAFQAASLAVMACLAAAMVYPALADGRPSKRAAEVEAVEVELFAAMEKGDIEVKLIPKDAKGGNVLITNKTDKPLKIALPEAFAGVPILAQFGGIGGGGGFGGGGLGGGLAAGGLGGGGAGQGFGAQQGLGGGFGGGGGGLGGGGGFGGGGGGFGGGGFGGGGGGLFNVAPEKTGKIKVTTVCLEHGKDEPNPRIAYTLAPLKSFKDDPKVYEVCAMLGRGEIDQASAQAAAWHLTDRLSFQELAAKIGIKHLNGSTEPFFAPEQVVRASQIVLEAVRRAEYRTSARETNPVSLSEQ